MRGLGTAELEGRRDGPWGDTGIGKVFFAQNHAGPVEVSEDPVQGGGTTHEWFNETANFAVNGHLARKCLCLREKEGQEFQVAAFASAILCHTEDCHFVVHDYPLNYHRIASLRFIR